MGLDMFLYARNGDDLHEVAYWRKANAIHRWFVLHVQHGEDECMPYSVTREQLQQLVDLCREVHLDPSKASTLLPTQSGFFFGRTDYDEWYEHGLEQTIDQLTRVLADYPADTELIYQSSW